MKCYKLEPVGVSQKSFYGKAKVIEKGDIKYLLSYQTIVAAIDAGGNFFRTWDGWSATTSRHVDSFRRLNDLGGLGKNAWEALTVYDPCYINLTWQELSTIEMAA